MEAWDLLIIGGGLTGLVAAWRSSQAGLSTILIAQGPGSLPFTSGALDLLGVYPTETKRYRCHPWEALSELIDTEPGHPYGRVGLSRVREAMEGFLSYLETSPLGYYRKGEENMMILTGAGTLKPTYAVPGTMKNNALAWEQKRRTLILGFEGFPDFSPEQIVGNLRDRWVGLRAARVDRGILSEPNPRPTAAGLAFEFERPAFRDRFVAAAGDLLGRSRFLGLPGILGLDRALEICRDLEDRLQVKVFEIPLLSPSLPGMRLADLLREDLVNAGVDIRHGAPVVRLEAQGDRVEVACRKGAGREERIRARHVVLATGRFFGGGLAADRRRIRETVIGLEIEAPGSRDGWHMTRFLGAPGHPINRVGVRTDCALRPLLPDGTPRYENVHAAGAILAGHDWVREKSGTGISIATGFAAVEAILVTREG